MTVSLRVWTHLQSVDDGLDVGLDGLVGELGAGQGAHALQCQVAQVGLAVLQELAQLVTGPNQQSGLTGGTGRGGVTQGEACSSWRLQWCWTVKTTEWVTLLS